MKLKNRFILAALVAAMGLTVNAGWVYTKTGTNDKGVEVGVLSDDNWSFGVTCNDRDDGTKGLSIDCTLEGFECRATEPCPIDFTSGITGQEGASYKVVEFVRGRVNNCSGSPMTEDHLKLITEFIAPDCISIGHSGVGKQFKGASNLRKVQFSSELKIAKGAYIFQDCVALKDFSPRTIRFNADVGYLFKGCKNLGGDFEIYEKTSVCNGMFEGTLVGKVTALNATTIGEYAFQNCSNFSNLVTNCKVDSIGRKAFFNCPKIDMEFVTKMLHKELKRLGNEKTGERSEIFSGCTGIEGEFVWNLPQIDTNIVPTKCFKDCTNITKVIFKTPIEEMREEAFLNLKEGAEIYLPSQVPSSFGRSAVGNCRKKQNKADIIATRWPKVYLSAETKDEWLTVMGQNNRVIRKENFNVVDKPCVEGTSPNNYQIDNTRATAVEIMAMDTDMCKLEDNKVTVYDRNVIGFVFLKKNYASEYYGCWVMKLPEDGFKVIVR